jgi:hypothetical protein
MDRPRRCLERIGIGKSRSCCFPPMSILSERIGGSPHSVGCVRSSRLACVPAVGLQPLEWLLTGEDNRKSLKNGQGITQWKRRDQVQTGLIQNSVVAPARRLLALRSLHLQGNCAPVWILAVVCNHWLGPSAKGRLLNHAMVDASLAIRAFSTANHQPKGFSQPSLCRLLRRCRSQYGWGVVFASSVPFYSPAIRQDNRPTKAYGVARFRRVQGYGDYISRF